MIDGERKNPTSKEDFVSFKEAVSKFINFFGLDDWTVLITHEDLSEHEGDGHFLAMCTFGTGSSKSAIISLNTDWGALGPNSADLTRVAFHEACHLLFADLDNIATTDEYLPFQRNRAFNRGVHALIHKFEARILPLINYNPDTALTS